MWWALKLRQSLFFHHALGLSRRPCRLSSSHSTSPRRKRTATGGHDIWGPSQSGRRVISRCEQNMFMKKVEKKNSCEIEGSVERNSYLQALCVRSQKSEKQPKQNETKACVWNVYSVITYLVGLCSIFCYWVTRFDSRMENHRDNFLGIEYETGLEKLEIYSMQFVGRYAHQVPGAIVCSISSSGSWHL